MSIFLLASLSFVSNRGPQTKSIGAAGLENHLFKIAAGLVEKITPEWAVVLIIIILLVAVGYRLYADRRKDRATNALLEEKDRSLQRVADEARRWRLLYFIEAQGWPEDKARKFLVENDFANGPEAREALEKGGTDTSKENQAHSKAKTKAKKRR